MEHAYKGEMMLLQWNESSSRGRTVTFLLPEDTEQHPFREYSVRHGKASGQRFMAVLVEIGSDEQPVMQTTSQLAAALCKDPQFQHWADEHSFDNVVDEASARNYILSLCQIKSRSELDKNTSAAMMFEHQVMRPFNEYRKTVNQVFGTAEQQL